MSDGTVGTNSYVRYYGYNIASDTHHIQDIDELHHHHHGAKSPLAVPK